MCECISSKSETVAPHFVNLKRIIYTEVLLDFSRFAILFSRCKMQQLESKTQVLYNNMTSSNNEEEQLSGMKLLCNVVWSLNLLFIYVIQKCIWTAASIVSFIIVFVDESVLNGIIKEYEEYEQKAELVKQLIYGAVFNKKVFGIAYLPSSFLAFTEQIGLRFRTLQGR